jgi:hypothetical protein
LRLGARRDSRVVAAEPRRQVDHDVAHIVERLAFFVVDEIEGGREILMSARLNGRWRDVKGARHDPKRRLAGDRHGSTRQQGEGQQTGAERTTCDPTARSTTARTGALEP